MMTGGITHSSLKMSSTPVPEDPAEARDEAPQAPADAAQTETMQGDAEMLQLLQKLELAALLKTLAKSL